MEVEDYADLLSALRRIYAEVVSRHGGEIAQIVGDGVTAIFGHPDAHEDVGRRAAEAALDFHECARRLSVENPGVGPGIRLHTGIHAGMVLVKVGDPARGRYEIPGDATNIASRLSGVAAADEIIVSETALGSDLYFFQTSEQRHVTLNGKDEPVAVYSILGRQLVENRFATRFQRGLVPFVGREAELAQLHDCLRGSNDRASHLAALVGEAGLGKTRLASEFLAQAAATGIQIHRAYCESYLGAQPLQPFLQLLRSIFEIGPALGGLSASALVAQGVERIGPELIGRLASLQRLLSLPSDSDGGELKSDNALAQSAPILRDLFKHLAAAGPLVVFIDDWQWADDASRQALDAIRTSPNHGMLFLLATREYDAVDAQMSAANVIRLSPLSRQESEATIGGMLSAPEPFMVTRIAEYSGGNPLFIEELCHALPHGVAGRGAEAGGAWLDVMIESRFSRLPADQAALVKAASVIGHMIPSWLFQEITGVDERHPAVAELARQDFIYLGEGLGTLRFKHGITRDAIYRVVGLHERRTLHIRVVQALLRHATTATEDEHFEALAYHYGAGGDRVNAAHYAERAGDKAMAVSALDRAQAQYRAALAALEGVDQSDEAIERQKAIVRKFGLASVVDPSRDQLPILQRAAADAMSRDDAAAIAWSEFWLGYVYYGLGECRQSISHCQAALRAAERAGDDKLVVQIRATLGQAHATACEYPPALALLQEAIDIKRRHRSGARQSIGLAYSISCKSFVLADQGQFDAAYSGFDEAIEILGGALHEMVASVLTQRSAACLWQGRMEEAAAYALEGGRIAERVKARYLFSMARALAAYAQWNLDRSPESVRTMVEATRWLEASDSQQFLSLNYGWLSEAMVADARIEEARRYAARALLRARHGDRLGEAMALRAMARAAAQGHGRRSPRHYLDRAMASAEARQSAHEAAKTRLCAAEIAFSGGDGVGARPLLAEVALALSAMQMPWFIVQVERLALAPVAGRSA
jgi:class 3 adenylate cyclase/tetratricopeptide (TPR) repeat protein